jgi:translocator assembly and maintenance protein 41
VYAFGYGSGVLSQTQHVPPFSSSSEAEAATFTSADENNNNNIDDDNIKMIDMILVVKDAIVFHQQNLVQNPDHYPFWARSVHVLRSIVYHPSSSWLSSSLGTRFASQDPNTTNAYYYLRDPGVYFNVTPRLKYGIVQYDALVDDLEQWKYLYIAGRLQKPVVEILCPEEDGNNTEGQRLKHVHQQQQNLPAALAAALLLDFHQKLKLQQQQLLLPPLEGRKIPNMDDIANELFSSSKPTTITMASDVYVQIAGLSYAGDPRVGIAEDPQKTQNLVHAPGQMERFDTLYRPSVQALERAGILSITTDDGGWSWDWNNPKAHQYLWSQLPTSVRPVHDLRSNKSIAATVSVKEDVTMDTLWSASMALQSRLVAIVAPAARCQAIKGVFTAGVMKSTQYAFRKLSKGTLGRITKP